VLGEDALMIGAVAVPPIVMFVPAFADVRPVKPVFVIVVFPVALETDIPVPLATLNTPLFEICLLVFAPDGVIVIPLPAVKFAVNAVDAPTVVAVIPEPVALVIVCVFAIVRFLFTPLGVREIPLPATRALVRLTALPVVVASIPDPRAELTEATPPPPAVELIVIDVFDTLGTSEMFVPAIRFADK
jgi:hypothetical protein